MGFRIIKPEVKEKTDEERMLEIMRNCMEHKNETYSIEKLLGLCRVSFKTTYDKDFKGTISIEELWKQAKRPKAG